MDIFKLYLVVYTLSAFVYLWYYYLPVLFITNKFIGNYKGKVSVIVPFYNENPNILERTIRSINNAYGEKEIVVIDDGSKSMDSYNKLLKLRKEIPLILLRYEKNKGKKYAQVYALQYCNNPIIVSCDSDGVLNKNAIVELIKPYSNPKIGATTGNVEVLNKNKNLLTKIQESIYWEGFNFYKKHQRNLNIVVCCSGAIASYRKDLFEKVKDEYLNIKFLGRKYSHGEDRTITTLILKEGYDAKYVKKSIVYTEVPEKFSKFIKQQIRWQKSWLVENFKSIGYFSRKNKKIAFDIIFIMGLYFFSFFARIGLIIALILNPLYFLFAIPMIGIMAVIHSLYALFHKPKIFAYCVIYSYLHAFFLYWLMYFSLFTMFDNSWGTR